MSKLTTRISRVEKRHKAEIESKEGFDRLLRESWDAGPESWETFVTVLGDVLPKYGVPMSPEGLQLYRDHGPPPAAE